MTSLVELRMGKVRVTEGRNGACHRPGEMGGRRTCRHENAWGLTPVGPDLVSSEFPDGLLVKASLPGLLSAPGSTWGCGFVRWRNCALFESMKKDEGQNTTLGP